MLERYATTIEPWARNAAQRMLNEVNARDAQAWTQHAKAMGVALRKEVANSPTGEAMKALLQEQIDLITSLPRQAGERVHELALKGLSDSTRASEIAKEIQRSGEVTKNRATLIARTEVARVASTLTQVRAQHVGSTEYIWRTSGDSDVRPGHKAMNGKVCRWDSPPAVNEGTANRPHVMHHHAGAIWNCRCYPEPIIPEDDE